MAVENGIDFEAEDNFEEIVHKVTPHYTGWKCLKCGNYLYDESYTGAFFICKNCELTFFKHEIRDGFREENCPVIPVEYDWEEEWRRFVGFDKME